MLKILLVAIGIMVFAFFLFSLRILFVKGGEFRGTCASNNPMLQKEGAVCGACGRTVGEPCGDPDNQAPSNFPAFLK